MHQKLVGLLSYADLRGQIFTQELAQKARYSAHKITPEEQKALYDFYQKQPANMSKHCPHGKASLPILASLPVIEARIVDSEKKIGSMIARALFFYIGLE